MKVYVHIYNENLVIDHTPSVAVDLDFVPLVGDIISLSDEDLIDLQKQVTDSFTAYDVLTWRSYIYRHSASLLRERKPYDISKEDFCRDLSFIDAKYVVNRYIITHNESSRLKRGLHIEISSDTPEDMKGE